MTDELRDISHTNPYTDESFGERVQVFDRGTTIAADGGHESDGNVTSSDPRSDGGADPAEDETESSEQAERETMEDVDHEPPNESDGANRVYERGTEGKDDSV
jgi:hypothetical protein